MKGLRKRTLTLVIAITLALFFSNIGVVSAGSSEIPSYQEVYDRMIALKEKYPDGMRWDENYPFGPEGEQKYYYFEATASSARACAAFVYVVSDEAFGPKVKARSVGKKNFTYEMIQVGDILKIVNSMGTTHYVIVLEVATDGVTIAEGNYGGIVNWGRFITREYIEENFLQLITRYPDTSYHYATREENKRLYDSEGKQVDIYKLNKKKVLTYKNITEKKVEQAGFDIDGDLIFRKTNGTVKVIDHLTLEVRTIYTDIDKLLPKRTTGLIVSVKYGKMTEKIKK